MGIGEKVAAQHTFQTRGILLGRAGGQASPGLPWKYSVSGFEARCREQCSLFQALLKADCMLTLFRQACMPGLMALSDKGHDYRCKDRLPMLDVGYLRKCFRGH